MFISTNFGVSLECFDNEGRDYGTVKEEEIDRFIKDRLDGSDGIEDYNYQVVRYCFAAVCYHYEHPEEKLHVKNSIRA